MAFTIIMPELLQIGTMGEKHDLFASSPENKTYYELISS
jgi:hypothetical protein